MLQILSTSCYPRTFVSIIISIHILTTIPVYLGCNVLLTSYTYPAIAHSKLRRSQLYSNMKFLTILAFGVSVALGAPYEPTSPASPLSPTNNNIERRSSIQSCDQESISACVAATRLDGPGCFAKVCTSIQDPELRRRQATDDGEEESADEDDSDNEGFKVESTSDTPSSCTQDNLMDCAISQWKNPDVCFQQLCL